MTCRNCGERIEIRKGLNKGGLRKQTVPDECPNCGAKLRDTEEKSLIRKGV